MKLLRNKKKLLRLEQEGHDFFYLFDSILKKLKKGYFSIETKLEVDLSNRRIRPNVGYRLVLRIKVRELIY